MSEEGLASRRAALRAVRAVEDDGAFSNLVVPQAVAALPDPRERAFASNLAYATLRWRGTLDWALDQVLRRPRDEVEPALLRVLRTGACQLLRLRVPDRAAVDTSAALARDAVPRGRAGGAAGFVNGVLRQLARRAGADSLPWPDPDLDPVGHLALTTGHPRWAVADLRERLGHPAAAAVLAADNEPPGLSLRAAGDRAALVSELRSAGFDARPGTAPEAVRAPGADPRRLPAVAEGRATPQDEASMQVVHAAGVRPGDRILDLCAGPGGKSTHLAVLAGPAGHVVAVEAHAHRARLVGDAAARLGVTVDVRVGDARHVPDEGGFDVVLLDAPCTGLGTGRRRPEVRWRRTSDDVTSLAALQAELLAAAARRVRAGGTLVYAVCTWTAAETVGVAHGTAAPRWPRLTERQLRPDTDDTDGMYLHVWQRPAS